MERTTLLGITCLLRLSAFRLLKTLQKWRSQSFSIGTVLHSHSVILQTFLEASQVPGLVLVLESGS